LTIPVIVFGQKNYTIQKAVDDIKLDGIIEELTWSSAQQADSFVVNYPSFGAKPSFETKVYLTYTDEAFYVAARITDNPDSISYMLSQRDNFGNSDWFGILIDPYGNKLNAFNFYVTAAGVELDASAGINNEDFSWNAVWRSKVVQTATGWDIEIRIPYAALRFPNKDVQKWNVNFVRQIRRKREMSYWNPVNPEVFGEITQSGKLTNLKDIEPPMRLSFSPYSISYLESFYDPATGNQESQFRSVAGMDLKLGLNDAFTLDMALVPDFGQTISDNQVLNLGPFEVQFDENRSFFKEGTDLFGISGLFYSRRVGGHPFFEGRAYENLDETKGEFVKSNATQAPLYNGTKVSGRTKNGLGIGFFNAVEGRTTATISDSLGNTRTVDTNPLTNYNVSVLSQNLKNNGLLSLINTNVAREGSARDANVSALSTSLFSSDRKYNVQTEIKVSAIMEDGNTVFGHNFFNYIGKVQGAWTYGTWIYEETDTYDPNDLGFLYNNNSRGFGAELNWNGYKPKGRFLRRWGGVSAEYEQLYFPKLFNYFATNAFYNFTFKNFMTCGVSAFSNPLGRVDHFESRKFGVPLNFNPNVSVGGWISSDYSRPFALDVRANYNRYSAGNQDVSDVTVSPRFQFSSRFFLVLSTKYEHYRNDYGFVSAKTGEDQEDILIGTRDRDIITNSIVGEVIFTKRMGVYLRLRHYWQRLNYSYFNDLMNDGDLRANQYYPLNEEGNSYHNNSYNAFTVDVNFRWVFFPGCEFLLFYKNNIFASKNGLDINYFRTFDTLFDQPQFNSFSAKVQLFVDALYFKKGGLKM
jgi:hypothetical protein